MLKRIFAIVFLMCLTTSVVRADAQYDYAVMVCDDLLTEVYNYWVDAMRDGHVPYDPVCYRYSKGQYGGLAFYQELHSGNMPIEDIYNHIYFMSQFIDRQNRVVPPDHPYANMMFPKYPIPPEARYLHVKVKDGNINYFSVVGPMMSSLYPVFFVGLCVGLSILAIWFVYGVFRRLAVGGQGEKLYGAELDGSLYVSNREHSVDFFSDEFKREHGRSPSSSELDDLLSRNEYRPGQRGNYENVYFGP